MSGAWSHVDLVQQLWVLMVESCLDHHSARLHHIIICIFLLKPAALKGLVCI